jgi:hypothetical protein
LTEPISYNSVVVEAFFGKQEKPVSSNRFPR